MGKRIKYSSYIKALNKLIKFGDTRFKNLSELKNKIKEMTGKRPAGSFNTTQTDYEKLLKKFTFTKKKKLNGF